MQHLILLFSMLTDTRPTYTEARVCALSSARTEFDAGRALHSERRDGHAGDWFDDLARTTSMGEAPDFDALLAGVLS